MTELGCECMRVCEREGKGESDREIERKRERERERETGRDRARDRHKETKEYMVRHASSSLLLDLLLLRQSCDVWVRCLRRD